MENKQRYKQAKKDLELATWKTKHLTGSDSFTYHNKMHIFLLKSFIHQYEKSISSQVEVIG